MIHVTGEDAAEAWIAGARQLLAARPDHAISSLITEIQQPTREREVWYGHYNPRAVGIDEQLSVVANVLFPKTRNDDDRAQVYASHTRLLERARRLGRVSSAWGSTYFERLMSLDGSENQV